MPAGDPKHPIAFDFTRLTDDEFDELVYLLAHSKDPRVAKLRAPDGGLDTVCVSDDDACVAAWGIQAKLHRQHIHWPNCKESLDRAVAVWRVQTMTFAFPRDLTVRQHDLFHKHLGTRHADIAVDWWGAAKLTALLLEHPSSRGIVKRFFHLEDPADLADRALRAGGPLRTAQDVVGREAAIGEFLHSADPHFDWVATRRSRSSTPVPPAPGQVLRLGISTGEQEAVYDAVPRAASSLGQLRLHGEITFEDAQDADRARVLLQAVVSQGGRADLGHARIRVDGIPAPFEGLLDDATKQAISVRVTRDPVPWPATIIVDTDLGHGALDVDLIPAEPEEEWDAKLVGGRHGLAVELRFVWSHSERVGSVNVAWRLGRAVGTSDECARVLRLMLALHGAGSFEIRGRDDHTRTLCERTQACPAPAGLKDLCEVFDNLAAIEAFSGVTFGPPPDLISAEDAYHLSWLASAMRDGGYDLTVRSVALTCTSESALRQLSPGAHHLRMNETLMARFFGRERPVATRLVDLPDMVVRKVDQLPTDEPSWKVELAPNSGHAVKTRVVLSPLYLNKSRAA